MAKPRTREMRVDNIAFLLDRLAADAPPNQQIRELTQNAIEAIERRWKSGDSTPGVIRWDVDWAFFKKAGVYKLSIADTGDGMTADEMDDYLNSLAVEGANRAQSLSGNFGVGAKITALHNNPLGLIYQSWKNGRGTMVKLHRDDDLGVYGLDSFDLGHDGFTYHAALGDVVKPAIISESGTKVVLLGGEEGHNTCVPPEGITVGGSTNWLYKYLNTRYFALPDDLRIQVRMLRANVEDWPAAEPPASDKTFSFETIRGMRRILDEEASASGSLKLTSATIHWWLFDDPAATNKRLSPRALVSGHVALVFQDELYNVRTGHAARRTMASFGLLYGSDHVVLYVVPRNGERGVHADTSRGRILIDGEDVDEAGWWDRWGNEFRERIPPPLSDLMKRLMALANRDPEGKVRERIRERLERIRRLLRPSRLRRTPLGRLRAERDVLGGASATGDIERARTDAGRGRGGSRGGRATDQYLADLIAEGGEPAERVTPKTIEPRVDWVSITDGTRAEDELVDMGAEIVGDIRTSDLIKGNSDFRGVTDVVDYFVREFSVEGDSHALSRIVANVREWMELQLVETVMTVRNLEDGRVWDKRRVEHALSPEALTAVMMARYQLVEKVRRALGNEIVKGPRVG